MVAVTNLVLCGAVVTVLMAARDGGSPAAFPAPATTDGTESTTETTTPEQPGQTAPDAPVTTTESGPDGDYEEVIGPGGMTTHIPVGWPVHRAKGKGAMQADDPAGTATMLRYGGSATDLTDSYDLHADYERTFASDKTKYVSIRLERTVVRGLPAIDWEFEYDAKEGRRHVRSTYWLHGGYEYFVYASATVPLWPDTSRLLDVMLTYSTP